MGIFLCNGIGHIAGESWSFGLHFSGGGGVTIDDALAAWEDAVALQFTTNSALGVTYQAYMATNAGIDDATVASISEVDAKQISKKISSVALAGTSVSATLPPQTAIAVSLRTNLATRGGRGRYYLPAPAENGANLGRIKADCQSAVLNGAEAMIGHMVGATLTPIVWHQADVSFDAVTRVDVGDVFDTQRRRRNKLVESRVTGTV